MIKLSNWRTLLDHTPEEQLPFIAKFGQGWNSCAVGEKLGFPDNSRAEIASLLENNDVELKILGFDFHTALIAQNKTLAFSILKKVEDYIVSEQTSLAINSLP